MFGGLSFLLGGHMSVGVVGDELIARVGPDRAEEALARPEARPMEFTGRPMRGWVTVAGPALAEDSVLRHWVTAAVAFACTLPRGSAADGCTRLLTEGQMAPLGDHLGTSVHVDGCPARTEAHAVRP